MPQTRPKNDSLQIMSDLFPEDLSGSQFLTIKLGIDTNRHKEILIKAISAILLLLLKHFKINHIYQFEFMSQHLLFANKCSVSKLVVRKAQNLTDARN